MLIGRPGIAALNVLENGSGAQTFKRGIYRTLINLFRIGFSASRRV